MICVSFWDLHY